MTAPRAAAAVVAGVVLAALPFWRYAAPLRSGMPHADHEPWYDGQLGMAGEHHVELVRSARGVEVYVSDAWRRPVRAASASLAVDGGAPIELRADGERLVADTRLDRGEATVTAVLPDGKRLAITFQLPDG